MVACDPREKSSGCSTSDTIAIAFADTSIAPSTDSSASRSCGGTVGARCCCWSTAIRRGGSVVVRLGFEGFHVALFTGFARYHHHLDGGLDVAPHRDRDAVGAERLDRVVQRHLAAVDPDLSRLPDGIGDVARGDRAVQPVLDPGAGLDREHGAVERVGDVARLLVALRLVTPAHLLLALHLRDHAVAGGQRQLPRLQEVAHVAGGDVHDVALAAQFVDVLQQDRLCSFVYHHVLVVTRPRPRSSSHAPAVASPARPISPLLAGIQLTAYGSRATSRARFTATATWRWCRRQAPVMRRDRI